jgi:valyl-tRNA synthetase
MLDGSKRSLAETVPFRDVYIHALVRDAHGDKMSKTKGNVVDPIQTVRQYGTDAVRFTLASMASPGTDIAFSVARTEGNRAFANKIWNAARFVFLNINRAAEAGISVEITSGAELPVIDATAPLEDRWITAELHRTAASVNASLADYRFDEAAQSLYSFIWGSFCDWYLEIVKLRLQFAEPQNHAAARAALQALVSVFESALRLLSPLMPFLTEEVWHALYDGHPPAKSIALAAYPVASPAALQDASLRSMELVQSFITETRAQRKEIGMEEKAEAPVFVHASAEVKETLRQNAATILRLARVNELRDCDVLPTRLTARSTAAFDLAIDYARTVDVAAEREKLTKEIARLEKAVASADRQLENPGFLAKAPANVVEGLKSQRTDSATLLAKSRQALAALPADS